eukprot:RCo039269
MSFMHFLPHRCFGIPAVALLEVEQSLFYIILSAWFAISAIFFLASSFFRGGTRTPTPRHLGSVSAFASQVVFLLHERSWVFFWFWFWCAATACGAVEPVWMEKKK